MELKQIAPWNWFKKENEAEGRMLPVTRNAATYPLPLARFHEEFDQLFENMLQGFPFVPSSSLFPALSQGAAAGWLKPSVDIAATEKEYTITAELPGVDEKEINVELKGDTLIIRGQKEHKKEEKRRDYYCVERSYGTFQRQLSLPEDADADGIQAACKNGILTLTLPRRASASDAKRITVNAA